VKAWLFCLIEIDSSI